jgi:glycosyltransferase involved in cell wall biosynthesis
MACGTPVVATAVGGITEQVVNGKTGLLSAPGDATELAQNALSLLQYPSDDMRTACASHAVQYSLDAQVHAFLSWYGEIIGAQHIQH